MTENMKIERVVVDVEDCSDFVMVKKSELKRLYTKIREYEKLLEEYEIECKTLQRLVIEMKQ